MQTRQHTGRTVSLNNTVLTQSRMRTNADTTLQAANAALQSEKERMDVLLSRQLNLIKCALAQKEARKTEGAANTDKTETTTTTTAGSQLLNSWEDHALGECGLHRYTSSITIYNKFLNIITLYNFFGFLQIYF